MSTSEVDQYGERIDKTQWRPSGIKSYKKRHCDICHYQFSMEEDVFQFYINSTTLVEITNESLSASPRALFARNKFISHGLDLACMDFRGRDPFQILKCYKDVMSDTYKFTMSVKGQDLEGYAMFNCEQLHGFLRIKSKMLDVIYTPICDRHPL